MTNEKRFALLIGNDKYIDTRLKSLVSPRNDVEELEKVLKDPNLGYFESVHKLIDCPADRVRKEIARFFSDKNRDDLLFIYFSGHGIIDKDDGTLYLALSDTDCDIPSATGLEARFISRELDKRMFQRVVVIFDCCYSCGNFPRSNNPISKR